MARLADALESQAKELRGQRAAAASYRAVSAERARYALGRGDCKAALKAPAAAPSAWQNAAASAPAMPRYRVARLCSKPFGFTANRHRPAVFANGIELATVSATEATGPLRYLSTRPIYFATMEPKIYTLMAPACRSNG